MIKKENLFPVKDELKDFKSCKMIRYLLMFMLRYLYKEKSVSNNKYGHFFNQKSLRIFKSLRKNKIGLHKQQKFINWSCKLSLRSQETVYAENNKTRMIHSLINFLEL